MSIPSFHRHFKAVTSTTPVQFQKRVRLQEAPHSFRRQHHFGGRLWCGIWEHFPVQPRLPPVVQPDAQRRCGNAAGDAGVRTTCSLVGAVKFGIMDAGISPEL